MNSGYQQNGEMDLWTVPIKQLYIEPLRYTVVALDGRQISIYYSKNGDCHNGGQGFLRIYLIILRIAFFIRDVLASLEDLEEEVDINIRESPKMKTIALY
jgi:hypothetical protein